MTNWTDDVDILLCRAKKFVVLVRLLVWRVQVEAITESLRLEQ